MNSALPLGYRFRVEDCVETIDECPRAVDVVDQRVDVVVWIIPVFPGYGFVEGVAPVSTAAA